MPTPEEILVQMENILDQVIKTAERLKDISRSVVSEEELAPLQRSQEELVDRLMKMDEAFKKAYKGKGAVSPLRAKIEKKLEYFQKLNASFIENLSSGQGVIQFDNKSKKNKNK